MPAQAKVVLRIWTDYANGVSQRNLVRALNDEGVPAPSGGTWLQSMVSRVLANPVYVGKVQGPDGELIDGQHEPIVGEELWSRVQAIRSGSLRRKPGRHPEGKHLLVRGMLRCAVCGGPMLARKAQGPGRAGERYFCKVRYEADENACSMPGIRRELIDEPFLASVLERHIDLDATVKRIGERVDAALVHAQEAVAGCEADVARVERALTTTERDYDAGELTARQYSKREDRLTGELEGAKAALEQARVSVRQMERAGPVGDAEQELLDRLATLKAAVAGGVAEAPDLPALRNVIAQMFDSIDLVRCRKTEGVYVIEAPARAAGVVLPHLDKWIGEGQAVARDGDTCYLLLPGLRYEALDPETLWPVARELPVASLMEPPTSPVA
jgi:hypothetical protein